MNKPTPQQFLDSTQSNYLVNSTLNYAVVFDCKPVLR
jgi:hypothetical protein